MIELITGLPGNAKTLHALGLVIERAARENRAVYYSGLKGFKEDDPRLKGTTWREFDPLKWHDEIPSGAIMLIDEAQKVFRARSLGSIPGKHVTELEEHRHKGLDFYMITQHPSLIDPAIRKLTQTHRHMVRIWGMEASTVHKWDAVREQCDKPTARKDSEKTKWAFNKGLYGLYHSADVHTMKRTIPGRVYFLGALVLLFVALVWYSVSFFSRKTQNPEQSTPAVASASSPAQSPGRTGGASGGAPADPLQDLKDYAWRETPRVSGLPHTAPKYDSITEPVRAPVPAACIQKGDVRSGREVGCKCYSQQGTPMAVEFNMCVEFARNGYFQDFDPERDNERSDRAERSQHVLATRPDYAGGSGGHVVAFASVPDLPRVPGSSLSK